jgi:hypothetical protein
MSNVDGSIYQNKPRGIRRPSIKPHKVMTRVTSGKDLLPDYDGRSLWARRMRDLIALMTSDAGGDDALTEAQRSLVRRAATLIVECERMELSFAQDDASPALLNEYGRASNTLRRLLETIGIERKSRDITPSLESYIGSRAHHDEDAEVRDA